ncbi:hypothetical protein HPP92_027007 [Vanilla planifolia]|uniref:Myb/SANT-like domain-containing protein n=1 Tax=Vanilla planifolia TaxID=51239 RepID=A0A835PC18_VANPL|nr:hypothetical protein HPP92_027007 [Vanilla planifolia]
MGKIRESGPSATWSYDITMMFCDLCLREIAHGNRPNTHFNKAGWSNLVDDFKVYTGRDYDRLQLKNKWDQLKKEWKLWKDLKKGAVGCVWNPKRKTLDASDEWWREKVKEFPAAKKFRYCGIDPEMEEKLDKMFMNMIPSDEHAWAPNSGSLPPNAAEEEGPGDFEDCESTKSPSGEAKTSNELQFSLSGSKRASQPSPKGHPTKFSCPKSGPSGAAQGVSQLFQEQMLQAKMLQTQIQQLVDAATSRSKTNAALSKSSPTIPEAVQELDSIEELEQNPDLYGFSLDLLLQKDSREMFMALKPHKRLWYLLREFEKTKRSFV